VSPEEEKKRLRWEGFAEKERVSGDEKRCIVQRTKERRRTHKLQQHLSIENEIAAIKQLQHKLLLQVRS